jgi:hypothetical protein
MWSTTSIPGGGGAREREEREIGSGGGTGTWRRERGASENVPPVKCEKLVQGGSSVRLLTLRMLSSGREFFRPQ